MDGILDFAEMHKIVSSVQQKIPLIGYNQRRSGIPERKDLPTTNWHFQINPVYKNDAFVVEEFKRRTSITSEQPLQNLHTDLFDSKQNQEKSHHKKDDVWNDDNLLFYFGAIQALSKN